MSNYPLPSAIPQLLGSSKEVSSGTEVDRAESGKPYFRSFFSQDWAVFRVLHEVYAADKDTLLAHYRSNRFNEFTFTAAEDNAAYTVRYAEHPQIVPIEGDQRFRVQTALVVTTRLPYGIVALTVSSSIACTGTAA